MSSRQVISFVVSLAMLLAACGGSPTTPGLPGSTPDQPASAGTTGGHTLPSFEFHGTSLESLAEVDERVWADGMRASGAAELLGPKLGSWLDEQRHAFVDAVLAKGGVNARGDGQIASTDPRFGAGAQAALGGGGLMLALTGGFLREFTRGYSPDRNGANYEFALPSTETHETEVDGHRATATMSVNLDFHFNGSRVDGQVEITITTTVVDADGNTIGTITVKSTARVDMEVCPDADGGLNGHFETDNEVTITGSVSGGGSSYHLATSGVATGQVGDDALLHGLRVTGESGQRVAGSGTRAVDAAVSVDVTSSLGTGGDFGTLTVDASSIREDVTRGEDSATSDDITRLDVEILGTGIIVGSLLFEAAQAKWRDGYCVRIEATESTRTVDPDEVIPFSARVFHNFEGTELNKPIVATLNGVKSAVPLDAPQDPPANITYTAGSDELDQGTVTLKSTSNRGIAILPLTFTVAPQLVLRFEMESEIKTTVLAGLPGGGTALAHGEIYLEKDATGHWSGRGDLTSRTTPARGGCNTATVAGAGSYNWWVRDVVVRPESTSVDLSMDAPPPNENPDIATTTFCPGGTTTSPINTWENLFFVAHFKDYQALGLHVTDWTIVATPDTWKTGGLVAEAEWSEDCSGNRAAPGAGAVAQCTGSTFMRLRLVPPPTP